MENKETVIGSVLVFFGIGLLGHNLGIWGIGWFVFRWWALFIIVPAVSNMKGEGLAQGNLMGLGIGITMFLVMWVPAFRPFAVAYLFLLLGLILLLVPKEGI